MEKDLIFQMLNDAENGTDLLEMLDSLMSEESETEEV